jgi:AraC-like DNA-binding protein
MQATPHPNDAKFMCVLEDRVFYHGLLGKRIKSRSLGAVTIYVATFGDLHFKPANGPWRTQQVVVVPPHQKHQLSADSATIIGILVEPERLTRPELARLLTACDDPDGQAQFRRRILDLANGVAAGGQMPRLDVPTFDRLVFGRELASRPFDPRIEQAIATLAQEDPEAQPAASDLATQAGLSTSRFLHLFKEQTGVSFRSYRMWRRARTFLHYANHPCSLTDAALSLGYPDSSHFSHSIRKIFGLKPRSIRYGSRDLQVVSQGYATSAGEFSRP